MIFETESTGSISLGNKGRVVVKSSEEHEDEKESDSTGLNFELRR